MGLFQSISIALGILCFVLGAALKHEINLVSEFESAAKVAQEQSARDLRNQKQITEDTKNGWEAALLYTRAHLHARPAPAGTGGLHYAGPGAVPTLPGAAGWDAGPAADRPADPSAGTSCDSQLEQLTAAATESAVTCFALQTWVRQQRAAAKATHD